MSAGTYTLTFAGTNALGDNTAFIDALALALGAAVRPTPYDGGNSLKRSEQLSGVLTTLVWDDDNYLHGRS